MTPFILGLIVFFGTHLFTTFARKSREGLIAKTGKGPYMGLYSLVSIAGFVLIIVGWKDADPSIVYTAPDWMRYATQLLMLLSLISLVAAYAPKGRIAAAAKHPMLLSVKLWALAHLLVNGEVRSIILFGSFLVYAAIDRVAVKQRGEPTPVAGPAKNDLIAVAVGAALWAAIYFFLHPYISGVSLRP